MSDLDNEGWLIRRVDALEKLLVCFRTGRSPSEKLFRELDITKEHVDQIVRDRAAGVTS